MVGQLTVIILIINRFPRPVITILRVQFGADLVAAAAAAESSLIGEGSFWIDPYDGDKEGTRLSFYDLVAQSRR